MVADRSHNRIFCPCTFANVQNVRCNFYPIRGEFPGCWFRCCWLFCRLRFSIQFVFYVPQELRPLHAKITALCASLERPLSYADAIIRRQTRNTASLRTASRAQLTACVAALVRQQGRGDA